MKLLHILVAEDNYADVILFEEALHFHKIEHRLHVVADGQSALQFVAQMGASPEIPCPDLMLLDLNMPKVDGATILQAFRKHPECAHTPVIVVTSSDAERDRIKVAQSRVTRYFRKPSDFDAFMELGLIIREVVEGRVVSDLATRACERLRAVVFVPASTYTGAGACLSMVNNSVSRRDFMSRASKSAGASLAAKTIFLDPIPGYAQDTPVAAGDRLRMGMIGVGEQGAGVLRRAIAHPGIECVAACDLWDGRHTLAREIVGKPIKCTRHYQELLDDKSIDIIINATPDHWHSRIVVDSCNAGKDIYSEKPMTHQVSEGFAMIAAAEKNKRIVEIGSGAADTWTSIKARELIASGAIGDVRTIEVSTGRNTPNGAWESWMPPPGLSPENLDWNTWLGNAPKIPFDPIRFVRWRGYRAYGTGVAGDLMVHLLTALINSAGIKEPPLRAHSSGGLYVFKQNGREYPDVHHVIYDYPGLQVIVKLMLTCESHESAKYYGTRGRLEIAGGVITITPQDGKDPDPGWYQQGYPKAMREAYEKQWHLDHDAELPKKKPEPVIYRNPEPARGLDHLGIFFEAVRTRNPKIVTEDAVFGNNAAIACHMANASYFSKSVAVWDAKARKIRTA